MLVENQLVEVRWNSKNKEQYTKINYLFTNMGESFSVQFKDIPKTSNYMIQISCDRCQKIYFKNYGDYIMQDKGEDICTSCSEKSYNQRHWVNCKFCSELIFKKNLNKNGNNFCNIVCRSNYYTRENNSGFNSVLYNCDNCKEKIWIKNYVHQELLSGKRRNAFCSISCKGMWESKNKIGINNPSYSRVEKICEFCGERYNVPHGRKDKSIFCSAECRQKSSIERILVTCSTCGTPKEVTPFIFNNQKEHFCNTECANSFDRKNQENWINCQCEQCDTIYSVLKSRYDVQGSRFCSTTCRNKWESINKRGASHPLFKSELVPCTYCSKENYVNQAKLKMQDNHFCNTECRQKWFAEVWSQSEEWKLESSERAVRMLSDGTFGKVDTGCQLIVNDILQEINIKYVNEYNCRYYAIDNYLVDSNLMIEVMGTYWHCDPRTYNKVEYQNQLDRIINDKRKSGYIKKQCGINLLYLWESDVLSNRGMCKQLIESYIKSNGILKNYHSFNYELKFDSLNLKRKLIKPYFEIKKTKFERIIDIKTPGGRRSLKQHDKWITYHCEICGKEKEQLKSHHIKIRHHYCSRECARIGRIGKKLNKKL